MTDSPPSKNDPLYNDHPLNQEAARWLKVAGVKPDPDLQYLFQLMRWGFDRGEVVFDPRYHDIIDQNVDMLLGYPNPKAALDYLCQNPEDPECPLLEECDLQQAWSPGRAVEVAFEALDMRLTLDPRLKYPPIYPFSPG